MPTYDPKTIAAGADPAVIEGFRKALMTLNASPYVGLALFEAGIVEANLKNPAGGDRDSIGSLQQRSQGWGTAAERMDPYQAALKFVIKANKMEDRYATAGQLAQAVQISAFPLRYDQAEAAARYVLKGGADTNKVPRNPDGTVNLNYELEKRFTPEERSDVFDVNIPNPIKGIFGPLIEWIASQSMRIVYFVGGMTLLILGGIILVKGVGIGVAAKSVGKALPLGKAGSAAPRAIIAPMARRAKV